MRRWIAGRPRSPSRRRGPGPESRQIRSGGLLRHVDDLKLRELLEPFLPEFDAQAGFLGTGEGDVRLDVEVLVHPYDAGIDAARHLEGPLGIRRPDGP